MFGIKNKRLYKKAFIFTIDAFLAGTVLIAGLLLLSNYLVTHHPRESVEYYSFDILTVLSEMKMNELSASQLNYFMSASNLTEENLTILEQAGTYWASGNVDLAINLTSTMLSGILPDNTGFSVSMDDEIFFEKNNSLGKNQLFSADRMITGVVKGAPLEGSTSSAYLRKISDKRTSSFAYFGGFVGQGNITVSTSIPSDVTSADITNMLLDVDVESNFTLIINDVFCKNLTNTPGNFTSERYDVTSCNSSIIPGKNNLSLVFSNQNYAYASGGYFRIDYKTDELKASLSNSNRTYAFPKIIGVVNLYDSFYIPGNLSFMRIYLHYLANHSVSSYNNTFYLTIGNQTILIDTDSVSTQTLTFDDPYLQGILNYSSLSQKTIPLRMGFDNISYESTFIGNSKVMLVTDVSGSMDWRMDVDSVAGTKRNCNDSSLSNVDTQRLSVAKCLDKEFAENVLNISGNQLGLVSYTTTTVGAQTVSPTTNLATIKTTIGNGTPATGYTPQTGTCICCGINSARDQLISGVSRVTLIQNKSSWKYNNDSFLGVPSNDSSGFAWYELNYDDSAWKSGSAVLGHYEGGSVSVAKELNEFNSSVTDLYANLWEYWNDTAGPPNDFSSSKLNTTGNTFGLAGADDGWDWAGGASAYGFDNSVDFNNASGQHLNMDFRTGVTNQNNCASNDCSGAYGIKFNVSSQMINYVQSNGSAYLSFSYEWDGNDDPFESNDQVWIKGKVIRPDGTEFWLGSDLDSSDNGADTDPEIATADNPDQDFTGNYLHDVSNVFNAAGMYYLHLGGKLRANSNDEWGNVYIDDVQLKFSNTTSKYYFRKNFTISDLSTVKRGFFNLLYDDYAKIYLNGNLIYTSNSKGNGTYWDVRGYSIKQQYFRTGKNVIAVELTNQEESAKFDLQLFGVDKSDESALLLMTDGVANQECAEQGVTGDLDGDGSSDTASDDAIQAACDARQNWGIQSFAVGFSSGADLATINGIASCGAGISTKSDNTTALSNFYNQVVLNIISASVKSQTIIFSGGNLSSSDLYDDSYIYYEYSPVVESQLPNEIAVELQSTQFNTCSPLVEIPPGVRVIDAKITSYSGDHWTKSFMLNSNSVFNLSEYGTNFINLGDPFVIQAPANLLVTGNNTLFIDTGDDPYNSTGCSLNNTFVYTALVTSVTSRSEVVEKTSGCEWIIEFEDNTNNTKKIPSSYNGTKKCSYTATNYTLQTGAYDPQDAYDIAVYNILKALDFDNNGKVFVNLDAEDIEIVITTISSVPYLWGPSTVEASTWQ